jgi:hypothetical protein
MDIILIEQILTYINIFLELSVLIFITYVFFDLVYIDRTAQLTSLSEKFQKFKRYDIFKGSLIFLVLGLYSYFFGKLAEILQFPSVAFTIFTLVGNFFLLVFTFNLYRLLHKYVPKE